VRPAERAALEGARVGRLATADADGRPHVVPCCFAFDGDALVSPIDEKPKSRSATDLRRVRDVRENPYAALVVDEYAEDWDALWWVQVRATATVEFPDVDAHGAAVRALREKYDQYAEHALSERPLLRLAPGRVVSWGLD
jgi:PPOX class probable F420-dependent enzyme